METFVKRMIAEHKELKERINKLATFIDNAVNDKTIHKVEYGLLCTQISGMVQYSTSLEQRLNLYKIYIVNNKYVEQIDVNLNGK